MRINKKTVAESDTDYGLKGCRLKKINEKKLQIDFMLVKVLLQDKRN